MDPLTTRTLTESKNRVESPQQQILRIRADLLSIPQVDETTLPSGEIVPMITCTLDELHDLVYAAASSYYREHTSSTVARAQEAARRLAAAVLATTAGTDYLHDGVDPRG